MLTGINVSLPGLLSTTGPPGAIESNWLSHTGAAVPFHSEEYKLPGLGTPELDWLRQTLAGKIARGASKPKPPPATADLTNTTNGAATFASSGSARTDLFFKVKDPGMYLPVSTEDTTTSMLQQVTSCLQFPDTWCWWHQT